MKTIRKRGKSNIKSRKKARIEEVNRGKVWKKKTREVRKEIKHGKGGN